MSKWSTASWIRPRRACREESEGAREEGGRREPGQRCCAGGVRMARRRSDGEQARQQTAGEDSGAMGGPEHRMLREGRAET
eukprot:2276301-Rhodomonas_salina.2